MIKSNTWRYNTILWIVAALIVSLVGAYSTSRYLSERFKPVLETQLRELVLKATDSLYHIEFSDVEINLITGGAEFHNVNIQPDTIVFNRLVNHEKAPNNIYYIQLKTLAIKRFHPFRLLRDKKLNIEQIVFDRPHIRMINKRQEFNARNRSFPDKTPYEYISRHLKEVRVNTIDFRNIHFTYINKNLPYPKSDSVDELNISLKDWLISPNSAEDPDRTYLLKDIQISLNDYSYATADSLYHVNVSHSDFKASTGILNIKSLNVVPRYDKMKFGAMAGFAKDRFDMKMSDIQVEGIDFPLYVHTQELFATQMSITNGYVSVFNNNELPRTRTDKTGKFPHQLLQQLEAKLTLGQVMLENIDLSYEEYDRDSHKTGQITFEKTCGVFTNITNSEVIKRKKSYLFANLRTQVMGKGRLDLNFSFDLEAENGAFNYSGRLGPLNGKELNRITKPLGMILVKRGDIKGLDFRINANDKVAVGELKFAYNNLSVALLKRQENSERLVRKGLISILANAMVINSDNPGIDGKFVSAQIQHNRVKTASFFNFVWKTLFTGIRHSVGITKEKEAEIRRQVRTFEKIKTDRLKRRYKKQQRKNRDFE